MDTNIALNEISESISGLTAEEGLALLAERYPGKITFSTSLGQEDQVISQIIGKHQLPIDLFSLDTGRLFPETLDVLERTDSKYQIKTKVYYPDTQSIEELVNRMGINGFYTSVENRKSCCFVRKVVPLKRALAGKSIWITGLRAEQSANRGAMQKIEWDEGLQIIKYNPLMDWTYAEMLAYIHENNIPYNPLHDRGFISIGCAPCTRAIQPGEDPRAGRWWWEDSKKECGLHAK
ncbi:phosphoadenosine phosphosulfate reductase [Rhodonellum psychrophilum GCM71 = DSM 17998]|uniref:Adenosine 5'-phosphosulfate reductase n=2 Tax=Rhodonellum TaxID=336827 RepID=U5BKD4_9BACT|nr:MULTISPECIES: phosphoadenylyl-sulfate reductase [Rhodonellum]ERM80910.1 phosphoadenosine phosphosulfate reductase [Rhodonellum psychrophilum GCM71 = DSM 17998]MDO9552259.1 phosphoadenylyl-sulfate reductase [Rhodonellum sp.]SDZ56919.1 phosphoadenylylsulfate reductase (thioredoxin) [Rhodonellum ikkaensis]